MSTLFCRWSQLKFESEFFDGFEFSFGFNWVNCTSVISMISWSKPTSEDGLAGSTNTWPGLAVDNRGFGTGSCMTFADPWPEAEGAELDNACVADDTPGLPRILLKRSSHMIEPNGSSTRFPNTIISASLGLCTTSTNA